MSQKKRIETSGSQAPLAGLGDAFAGINLPNLPQTEPKAPENAKPEKAKKAAARKGAAR